MSKLDRDWMTLPDGSKIPRPQHTIHFDNIDSNDEIERVTPPNPTDKDELRENLATIEHERWADWMEYMLDCAIKSGDDNIGVRTCGWPTAQFEHWQRQIETGYEELSDKEKSSDMEQVDRYWPLIEAYADQRVKEAQQDTIDLAIKYSTALELEWRNYRGSSNYHDFAKEFYAELAALKESKDE